MQTIQLPDPKLQRIEISTIVVPAGVSMSTEERSELSNAIGKADQQTLIQPPAVAEMQDGTFRLITGGRRVRCASASGWAEMLCLVYADMDEIDGQMLRVMENLTFTPLSPVDELIGLRLAYLAVNADAIGRGDGARFILKEKGASISAIVDLMGLLKDTHFSEDAPPVTWDELLTRLGYTTDKGRRKRFLTLGSIRADLLKPIADMNLNESKLRAIGGLPPGDQAEVVAAVASDPELQKLLAKIVKFINGGLSVTAAVVEAQKKPARKKAESEDENGEESAYSPFRDSPDDTDDGGAEVGRDDDGGGAEGRSGGRKGGGDFEEEDLDDERGPSGFVDEPDDEIQSSVSLLVESAQKITKSLGSLRAKLGRGGLMELPEPWSQYVAQSLEQVNKAVKGRR